MSRLIKSQYNHLQHAEKKVIHIQSLAFETIVDESPEAQVKKLHAEAEQILHAARMKADELVRNAEIQLQEATVQISKMKSTWEEEKAMLTEQVKQEGFQEGVQIGQQEVFSQLTHLIDEANSIVDLAKTDYIKQIEQSEETILKLGIKVAEKILKVHLKDNQENFMRIVKNAIKEVKDHADVSIKVHPSMYELVSSQRDELLTLFTGDKNLYVYPDADIEDSSCVIESSFGRIDASVDSQLTELKNKLLELLEEE
ncbi:flagellar assembly protein FliH [Bacillus suaedaesalsae]|uniref:Flagellar assembly protein FliH n=1 Tax=Bacillus suaedaesalsae TaxID=2810349 RepID=A0ABS2DLN4_9BACI|nr:flagellar assembly protein FliH [Bacillus suaedaesalsae]MBM6618446.1 flagellar assembly protein FliH [Bacillus suaedaesalsae]